LIAVDTNILVYAHRRDSVWHRPAAACVRDAAEGAAPWAIPWPCLHEFFAVVTRPRVFSPPSTIAEAVHQIEGWMASPNLMVLAETADHWTTLKGLLGPGRIVGGAVHDARIAALCLQHGVSELLTADRDFSRFPALRTRNPLV
jgi:hypothetical protein